MSDKITVRQDNTQKITVKPEDSQGIVIQDQSAQNITISSLGPQGIQGPKGEKGDKGDKGDQGPPATVITDNSLEGDGSLVDPLKINSTISIYICDLTDLSDFLNGSIYELPEGRYTFCNSIDFGTSRIQLIDTSGNYTFYNGNFFDNIISYSGSDPFIFATGSTPNSGIILDVVRMVFQTPNATTIDLINGNSLILEFPGFIGCKTAVNLDGYSFLTVEPVAIVGCENGFICNNIGTANIIVGQWSNGQDNGGTGFTFSGANSDRLFMTTVDSRPAASESYIDIQASYGGDAEFSGGVHTRGAGVFFKAGSRNQSDINIVVTGVKNVENSKYIGNVIVNGNNTQTVITTQNTWTDVNFDNNAGEGSNIERFTLDDSTKAEVSYLGLEEYKGSITGTFSVLSPGAQNYELRYVLDTGSGFNPMSDGVIIPFATDSATGTFPLSIPLVCDTGDKIKPQVRNIDGNDNITITHFSAGPANQ